MGRAFMVAVILVAKLVVIIVIIVVIILDNIFKAVLAILEATTVLHKEERAKHNVLIYLIAVKLARSYIDLQLIFAEVTELLNTALADLLFDGIVSVDGEVVLGIVRCASLHQHVVASVVEL